MDHMSNQPTFKKINTNTYEVRLSGVLAGTVVKTEYQNMSGPAYWVGFYNDGTEAYADYKRIDCAWRLINS